jgi:hypothetical protein
MNLAVYHWLSRGGHSARRSMLKVLDSLPPEELLRDRVLIQTLRSAAASPMTLPLPQRLQRRIYENSTAFAGPDAEVERQIRRTAFAGTE